MEYRAIYSDSLSHHGILGQKWGVRRFQNADGTWTEAGKKRYGKQVHDTHDDVIKSDRYKKAEKELDKAYKDVKGFITDIIQWTFNTFQGGNLCLKHLLTG